MDSTTTPFSSDYTEIKKRKAIQVSDMERTSSNHTTMKQYSTIQTTPLYTIEWRKIHPSRFQILLPVPKKIKVQQPDDFADE